MGRLQMARSGAPSCGRQRLHCARATPQGSHRTELVHAEDMASRPDALLLAEDRPRLSSLLASAASNHSGMPTTVPTVPTTRSNAPFEKRLPGEKVTSPHAISGRARERPGSLSPNVATMKTSTPSERGRRARIRPGPQNTRSRRPWHLRWYRYPGSANYSAFDPEATVPSAAILHLLEHGIGGVPEECSPGAHKPCILEFPLQGLVVPHPEMLRIPKRRYDEPPQALGPPFSAKAGPSHKCQSGVTRRVAQVLSRRLLQVGENKAEYAAGPEHVVRVGQRGSQVFQREMLEDMRTVDSGARFPRNRETPHDVSISDVPRKTRGILRVQRPDEWDALKPQGRRGIEVPPCVWCRPAAAVLDVQGIAHASQPLTQVLEPWPLQLAHREGDVCPRSPLATP